MKKFFAGISCAVLIFFLIPVSFADEPSVMDLQNDFFGTWLYEENDMYYTISRDRLIAYVPEDDTGFTVLITGWEFIYNDGDYSNSHPSGFRITGTIEVMKGNWWIGVGGSYTWIWFIDKSKNSLVTEEGIIYIKQ